MFQGKNSTEAKALRRRNRRENCPNEGMDEVQTASAPLRHSNDRHRGSFPAKSTR